ncbi:MAG: RnfABCDGE type electron transport complex subunit B [Lachnospiraceae bacterium]|nr:RnfABCDGE type electron transport complex subunit B [Lachnospiraceae bacterium]
MNMMGIILATVMVGGTGAVVAILLGVASEKFKVPVDEKEIAVRECLPGNNCGGCGFAGCDALAKAIAAGEAPVGQCPVGGKPVADKIAAIMGVEAGESERKVAFVKCSGDCEKAKDKNKYQGIQDCVAAASVPGGGPKACGFGCTGFGSCTKVCEFDAIHVVNGVAQVEEDNCVACGKCVATCPKHLIELIPYGRKYRVTCNSNEFGKDVKLVCGAGCIGCKLCEKQCKFDAIHVENNIAHIDYDKCTQCGACAAKCPVKVIH